MPQRCDIGSQDNWDEYTADPYLTGRAVWDDYVGKYSSDCFGLVAVLSSSHHFDCAGSGNPVPYSLPTASDSGTAYRIWTANVISYSPIGSFAAQASAVLLYCK